MIIILPKYTLLHLVTTLTTTWHEHRKSFTILEGVIFLVNLEHATSVYPWGRYLYCVLCRSANHCIGSSMQDMSKFPQLVVMSAQFHEANTSEEEVLFDRFFKAKVSKSLYKSKKNRFCLQVT